MGYYLNSTADLWKIGLAPPTESVDDRTEAGQHDLRVIGCLFLESVENTVDKLLLQAGVDIRSAQIGDHLIDRFHHHLKKKIKKVSKIY